MKVVIDNTANTLHSNFLWLLLDLGVYGNVKYKKSCSDTKNGEKHLTICFTVKLSSIIIFPIAIAQLENYVKSPKVQV